MIEAGGARWATRGAGRPGGDGQDGQPPRPAGQVPGRWGRERRLTGVRWPEGWECERCGCATRSPVAGRNRTWQRTRCSHHLSVTAGTATRHPEARLRGAMARSECLRRAVGRGRGGRLPRRRARQDEGARAGAVHGHAADARGGRAHLRQARAPLPQGRPGLRGPDVGVPRAGHVDGAAHVRADGWRGAAAGPGAWPGLDQRKFDVDGRDASLPTVRHVISNLESWAAGTFHGLSTAGPRSYADDLSWRYSHRGCDATTALVADYCLGCYRRDQLRGEVFGPQPPVPVRLGGVREAGGVPISYDYEAHWGAFKIIY